MNDEESKMRILKKVKKKNLILTAVKEHQFFQM